MPGFTFEVCNGEPIIIHTILDTWDTRSDLPNAASEAMQALDSAQEPLYYITDLLNVPKSLSLSDLIWGANYAARTTLRHPNIKEYLVVTESSLVSLAMKGLSSEAFGKVSVRLFATREDALAYARSR
jgi:hypothetical protein